MSAAPLGAGYDRALDVLRAECFARQPTTTKELREWEATGFTVFDAAEVGPKVRSAIGVGIKIDPESARPFGTHTASLIGSTGELPRFVTLARFNSHSEVVGAITAPSLACLDVPNESTNAFADFATICGDSVLSNKTFGGHLLLSWRRSPTRPSVDELMGSMLGARTVGATFDLLSNLTALKQAGLGKEELFVEWQGLPQPPTVTLPGGMQGRTVDVMVDYVRQLAQQSLTSFTRVTNYTLAPVEIGSVDLCLAETGRRSPMSQFEWACVSGHVSALVNARDGTGDLAHFEDKYIEAKLVSEVLVPAGRVVFNTVAQSRCPTVDLDGDPRIEASGPCQAQSVVDFIKFYEACAIESAHLAADCRNRVLGNVDTCADFEAHNCRVKELTLSNGQRVTCSEQGMAAAMADMVPWVVNPPFMPLPPFDPPTVMLVDESVTTLPFTPLTHLCAITGVRGGLHEADFSVANIANEWQVSVRSNNADPAFKPQVEVTCSAWENFYFHNGGSHSVTPTYFYPMPAGNALGASVPTGFAGIPILSGVMSYLDEPKTSVLLDGAVFSLDLFPLVSVSPSGTMFSVSATAPASGPPSGGDIVTPMTTPRGTRAGFIYPARRLSALSFPLPSNAFCFVTGLNGRYFNTSDWSRIDTSDGFVTLRVSTPITKDRNPGVTAQCAAFDHP